MDRHIEHTMAMTWPRNPSAYRPFPAGGANSDGIMAIFLENSVIEPISAVEWKSSPAWRLGPRTLQNSMWMFVLEGAGRGWIGDPAKTFAIRKNDFVLFPKGIPHDVVSSGNHYLRYINVHFSMKLYTSCDVMHLLNLRGRYRYCGQCLFFAHTQTLARIFAVKPSGWKPLMSSFIFQVMVHICYYHADNITQYCDNKLNANLIRLLPVFDAVERGLDRNELGVKDLSKAIWVSEVCLRKLFNQSLGISPNTYLRQKRIDRACRMLRESDQSINEISGACGFSDRYYFHKTFKDMTGTTPRKYRESKDCP